MSFDWPVFFRKHNIQYVTSGKNTKAGEYSISCLWCNKTNNKDPSQHLGINPKTGAYSCWRNKGHRGSNAVYLIKNLLNISFKEALEIYGIKEKDPEALQLALAKLRGDQIAAHKAKRPKSIEFPANTYPVTNTGSFKPYFEYLIDRGFNEEDIPRLVEEYGLRCAITGPWAGRVLLPITYKGKLVSWTGRAINDATGRLRYLNTAKDESVMKQPECLYLYDEVMAEENPDTIYVLEGPFDALKLDFYGKPLGIRAVAMFTNTLSEDQRLLVSNLADTFRDVVIMLDTGWFHQSLSLASLVTASNVRAKQMIAGFKDVGDMTKSDIELNF